MVDGGWWIFLGNDDDEGCYTDRTAINWRVGGADVMDYGMIYSEYWTREYCRMPIELEG